MEIKNILLIACCFGSIVADIFDFNKLEPAVPTYESVTYDIADRPGMKAVSYLNDNPESKKISYEDLAERYMKQYHSSIDCITTGFTDDKGVKSAMVHMVQTYQGYEISNSAIKIHMSTVDHVVTDYDLGTWKVKSVNDFSKKQNDKVQMEKSLSVLAKQLGTTVNLNDLEYHKDNRNAYEVSNVSFSSDGKVQVKKVYVAQGDKESGHLEAAWELTFLHNFVYTTVDLKDSNFELFSGIRYVSNFNPDYSTIISNVNPTQTFYDPVQLNLTGDLSFSPFGWHEDNKIKSLVTVGNNARVRTLQYYTTESSERIYLGKNIGYNDYNEIMRQSFYIVNLLHDAFYLLGFDEVNGNMQKYNFGKGGKENDRVTVVIDDVHCINDTESNPFMSTNGDGYISYLMICVYDERKAGTKFLDTASLVLSHEYTHAVVGRLVKLDNPIFGTLKAPAYGMEVSVHEALGDFFAEAFHYKPGMTRNTPFYIPNAKRKYKISSDTRINPYTYSSFDPLWYNPEENNYHEYGQIFAVMLHEVLWEIIDHYPSQYTLWDALYNNISEEDYPAYITLLKGILTGVKSFTIGSTTFLNARDHIINGVKKVSENDEFVCFVMRGFAKRGLGFDDFTIPAECEEYF
ncbi:hypothetical protein PIROE2DRAFT_14899 [Piromyces sp. E2]|nr:hypothetical protein PIROE2DRAFT_14899 [Piromyces sp. E2]|eukprot:OUM59540.1 hypothetical protein PIROE2DRAFT_14899 [Piromyces sp. E2]